MSRTSPNDTWDRLELENNNEPTKWQAGVKERTSRIVSLKPGKGFGANVLNGSQDQDCDDSDKVPVKASAVDLKNPSLPHRSRLTQTVIACKYGVPSVQKLISKDMEAPTRYAYWSRERKTTLSVTVVATDEAMSLICKDSWPLSEHESRMLRKIQERQASPDVFSTISPHYLSRFCSLATTKLYQCEVANYPTGESSKSLWTLSEPRFHTYTIGTKGRSLYSLVEDPVSLSKALLDVAICT